MTIKEKINIIESMKNTENFNNEHFSLLYSCLKDESNIVRNRAVNMLSNFQTEDSLELLINMCDDNDAFVRTEVYDTLSSFACKRTAKILYNAMQAEKDEVARSYAILSWSKVVKCIYSDYLNNIYFLLELALSEKSERCILFSYCGAYILGYKKALQKILNFIENNDYTLRYSTANLLSEIIEYEDKDIVISAIKKKLNNEETIVVRSSMEKLILKLQNMTK